MNTLSHIFKTNTKCATLNSIKALIIGDIKTNKKADVNQPDHRG